MGKQLGVRLFELWKAGTIVMPMFADGFSDTNRKVNETQGKGVHAFTQISGDLSQVYDSWKKLRDASQKYLADNASHMHNMAGAVIDVMNDYKKDDAEAAAEVDKDIKNLEAGAIGNPSDPGDDVPTPDDVPKYVDPVTPGPDSDKPA
ncbi:MAG TPA: hypothetical protein VE172_20095 [Stackebrandtia sp.]|uniref:hypothetical protein n=1 Tax=Stackebrandtia sp. TaxID=2023065 RepID=UPI002D296295|nr:hypothetical protein [Stackebrandtia sp.]HZE41107.1 hypothetical protein [Stackebrandtia sp.]